MPLLKIRIVPFERALAVQILEQDESQRRVDEFNLCSFTASNGYRICSAAVPQISDNTLYIRGSDKSYDFSVETQMYSDNELRNQVHTNILTALQEWSAHGGFHGKVKETNRIDDNEWVF